MMPFEDSFDTLEKRILTAQPATLEDAEIAASYRRHRSSRLRRRRPFI